ncbi:MAG: biopolymer transporter ExbD [Bacteroidia bacterium]|nr:biopolymer transporter ExbD [Bacteroidia bacterium]
MSKFRKEGKKESPAINTSSLPDIVFMLLFFFMVATKMRDPSVLVRTGVPVVSETEKIVKKSWINHILVGPPIDVQKYGPTPKIQFDDKFGTIEGSNGVQAYITLKKNEKPEGIRDYLTTAIKADKTVKMGLIQDIKQELRKMNSLKLLYSASEGTVEE